MTNSVKTKAVVFDVVKTSLRPAAKSTIVVVGAFDLKDKLRRQGYRFNNNTLVGPGWVKDLTPETVAAEEKWLEGIGIPSERYTG